MVQKTYFNGVVLPHGARNKEIKSKLKKLLKKLRD